MAEAIDLGVAIPVISMALQRRAGCKVGLATMSYCPQVQRVLEVLELNDAFDLVASRDDVEHGKPDPAIYRLVAGELGFAPGECLVVEDSPSGIKAALAGYRSQFYPIAQDSLSK